MAVCEANGIKPNKDWNDQDFSEYEYIELISASIDMTMASSENVRLIGNHAKFKLMPFIMPA